MNNFPQVFNILFIAFIFSVVASTVWLEYSIKLDLPTI